MPKVTLSETPEQLVERVDRLYLDLARIYVRLGRLLGIGPRRKVHSGSGSSRSAQALDHRRRRPRRALT